MKNGFISINKQLPEFNAICEICYQDNHVRKARFISDDGFNGSPLWTDETGTYVIHHLMSGWRYINENEKNRKTEIISWLNSLPQVEN